MQYKFKAKDIKTGKYVDGDLAYAYTIFEKKFKVKPMIVEHRIHGGMVWIGKRYFIDENTITPICHDVCKATGSTETSSKLY